MDRAALETEIGKQQDFFNEKLLPELLKTDPGKWAVVRNFELIGLFATLDEAVNYSHEHYGFDQPNVIAEIEPLSVYPTNLTWDLGLMR